MKYPKEAIDWLYKHYATFAFARSVYDQLTKKGYLTPKQIQAVLNFAKRY